MTGSNRDGSGVEKLTEAANRHLYAGELVYKIAVALDEGARDVGDADRFTLLRISQMLIDVADSELMITRGLCDFAEAESC